MGTGSRVVPILLAVLLSSAAAETKKQPEKAFSWDHEGYAKLFDAARTAGERKSRILVGLSGSPH